MESHLDDIYKDIKYKFKFEFDLKNEQRKLLEIFLSGKDAVGFLPTGYGKSMCYILPPLILNEIVPHKRHTALVISSLLSLMKDQVKFLESHGIAAAFITNKGDMGQKLFEDVQNGQFDVVFSSPESAVNKLWTRCFRKDVWQAQICLLAVDESHCISEWGECFRPDYRDLSILRSIFQVPVLALTATVTKAVYKDIKKYLIISDDSPGVSVLPNRPNIYLQLSKCTSEYEEKLKWIADDIKKNGLKAMKTLIFCRSIPMVSGIYLSLCDELLVSGAEHQKSPVEMFHASLDTDSKERIMEEYPKLDSQIRCLVSTVAFGMGINIPDIDVVIHWGAPKSILSYWQEVGRCARDRRRGEAILFAYGHSLSPSRTSEDMREMFSGEDNCFRRKVLKNFLVEGMDTSLFSKESESCSEPCVQNLCACQLCCCCNYCYNQCKCKNKKSPNVWERQKTNSTG